MYVTFFRWAASDIIYQFFHNSVSQLCFSGNKIPHELNKKGAAFSPKSDHFQKGCPKKREGNRTSILTLLYLRKQTNKQKNNKKTYLSRTPHCL